MPELGSSTGVRVHLHSHRPLGSGSYRAAIIHGLIAVDDLVEVGLEVEDTSADREKARSSGPSLTNVPLDR
jgi:hypothetical protein